LAPLQRQLLAAAAGLARPGGAVLYATCSPDPAETTRVAAAAGELGLEPLPAGELLPGVPDAAAGDAVGNAAQLWPHRHGTDAMYLAAFRKAAPGR
jgi:16S rRNA (cytosine967-C5)-methyltransferase